MAEVTKAPAVDLSECVEGQKCETRGEGVVPFGCHVTDPEEFSDVYPECRFIVDGCWYQQNGKFGHGDVPNRDIVRILPVAPVAEAGEGDYQTRVHAWMLECFGAEISADIQERNHRFLEESLELVQSLGCTASEAHQLVDYVFGRDAGDPLQELGGVMVTAAALATAAGHSLDEAAETELKRVWGKVSQIRAKQAAKPKHSPLPQSPAPSPPVNAGPGCAAVERLIKAAREIVRTVDLYDTDDLLALDNDPHPPSGINAAADWLRDCLKEIDLVSRAPVAETEEIGEVDTLNERLATENGRLKSEVETYSKAATYWWRHYCSAVGREPHTTVAADAEFVRELDAMRDALWVCMEHNRLHFGGRHNTVLMAEAALGDWKPSTPAPPSPPEQSTAEVLEDDGDETEDDAEIMQVLEERDDAEELANRLYRAVMGHMPPWSNLFGYQDAINDVEMEIGVMKKRPPQSSPAPQEPEQSGGVIRGTGKYRTAGNETAEVSEVSGMFAAGNIGERHEIWRVSDGEPRTALSSSADRITGPHEPPKPVEVVNDRELTAEWFQSNGFDLNFGMARKKLPEHKEGQFGSYLDVQRAKDGSIEWRYGAMYMPPGCHPQTIEHANRLMAAFTPFTVAQVNAAGEG